MYLENSKVVIFILQLNFKLYIFYFFNSQGEIAW